MRHIAHEILLVYKHYYYPEKWKVLLTYIQSNKENRKLHFEIDSVLFEGSHIDFEITNDRFGISAKIDPKENQLFLTYANTGGEKTIALTKLNPTDLIGYKPLSEEKYSYKIPDHIDGINTASLEEVDISPSILGFMSEMNSGKYDHIHSIIITKDSKLVFEEYFLQKLQGMHIPIFPWLGQQPIQEQKHQLLPQMT